MTPSDDPQTRQAFVQHTVAHLQEQLQGLSPEYDEIHEEMPRNLAPSGALLPRPEGQLLSELEQEFGRSEYEPSALGFTVKAADGETVELTLGGSLSVYYPVFPTHAEVSEFLERYSQGSEAQIKLPPKYRRVAVTLPTTTVEVPLEPTGGYRVLDAPSQALQRRLAAAADQARNDADLWKAAPRRQRRGHTLTLSRDQLADEGEWEALVASAEARDDPAEPEWSGRVYHRVRRVDDGWMIEILLSNTSPLTDWVEEEAFLGVQLSLEASREDLVPIHLPEVEGEDYRYSPWTWAAGSNCDTEVREDDGRVQVATDSVPVYVQNRIEYRRWHTPDGREIRPTFESLSQPGGLDALDELADAMDRYLEGWDASAETAPGSSGAANQVAEARAAFEAEVDRFKRGIEVLRDADNGDLRKAFLLTNEAFDRRFKHRARVDAAMRGEEPSGEPPAWRLFQLVFVVSQVPDLLHRDADPERRVEDTPDPSVLWFPTGGGKTEAYLGLVVLHAFWDRLRGKPYGVTAIAKFPLRMLSIQQFSRVDEVFEHAELLRQETPLLEGRRGDPFSVGYYAGSSNSWNLLDFPVSPDRADRDTGWTRGFSGIPGDERRLRRLERDHNKVSTCPLCFEDGERGTVETTFDPDKPGFRHECRDCGHRLNLHLTDTEVLRRLPTFVLGTIDKFARVATEQWGRAMFGEARVKCDVHGYLLDAPRDDAGDAVSECPVRGCGRPLRPTPQNVDPAPGLLVQDELHLLTESLGAFASHYETMMKETLRVMQDRGFATGTWKIVGSTATIEGYQHLVRQLYNYETAVRFPVPGPTREESFYVRETDEPQRYVLGVRSHGLSHVDTVMKVLLEYHRLVTPVAELSECPPGTDLPAPLQGISDDQRRSLARRYRTPVTYGIRKSEVAQVNNSYVGQLNPHLAQQGFPRFEDHRVVNLTGDSSVSDIQDFLAKMERDPEDYIQAVTATSIISHGVDLDDLNAMVFRGMPHTMAEYIQSMSRVGRASGVPALVVNVYNPNRERDSSHFESHKKYLELRDILLRHVPTTRFSRQALDKTVPGLLLHVVNYGDEDLVDLWKKTTVDGLLEEVRDRPEEFVDGVKRRLGLVGGTTDSPLVRRQEEDVERKVKEIRVELQRRSQDPSESRYASDRLGALRSLRETDEAIPIYSKGTSGGDDE